MPDLLEGYQLPSWPKTKIDRPLWDAVMGDIHARLKARELLEASFELLQQQGIQAALDYIQVSVAPQLSSLQQAIANAQATIDEILGGNAPNAQKLGGQLPSYYASAQALADGLASKASASEMAALIEQRISQLVDSSPASLDTLKELAAALGSDPNFATTMTTALAGKVNDTGDTMTGRLLIDGVSPVGLAVTKLNNLNFGVQATFETKYQASGPAYGPKTHYHKATVVEWTVGILDGATANAFGGWLGGNTVNSGQLRWRFETNGQLVLSDGTNASNYTTTGDIGFSGGMAGLFGNSLSVALSNRPAPSSLAAGAVGSYLFGNFYNGTGGSALSPGDIVPGSQVYASSDNTYVRGAQQTGTWRCMGQTTAYTGEPGRGTTLFLRVS